MNTPVSVRQRDGFPLVHGERVDYEEFASRWDATPELKRAELVGGTVLLQPEVPLRQGEAEHDLAGWTCLYKWFTPGVCVASLCSIRLDRHDALQPAAVLFRHREVGGLTRRDEFGAVVGPPDLVAEVVDAPPGRGPADRAGLYRAAGVTEYVVHRVGAGAVDWFAFDEPQSPRRLKADERSVIRSEVFPGLWLHVPGLLQSGSTLRDVLQEGLASPEHAAFKQQLADKMAGRE